MNYQKDHYPNSPYVSVNTLITPRKNEGPSTSSPGASNLKISQPGDPAELEAGRVADQIVHDELQEKESPKEPKLVQTKQIAAAAGAGADSNQPPSLGSQINHLSGKGGPLPDGTQTFFESRFNYDFGDVRIHTDSQSQEMAQSINAKAFTFGNDIVFGKSEFQPETAEGKKLIAHELTHVMQQDGGIHRNAVVFRKDLSGKSKEYCQKYNYYMYKFAFLKQFISEADFDANIDKYIEVDPWSELLYELGTVAGLIPGIIEWVIGLVKAIIDLVILIGKYESWRLRKIWNYLTNTRQAIEQDINFFKNTAAITAEITNAVQSNPEIIGEIFNAFGAMIKGQIGNALTEWAKKEPFRQGFDVGKLTAMVIVEVASWFIGIGEISAALKGTKAAAGGVEAAAKGAELFSKFLEILGKLKLNKLAELITKIRELPKALKIAESLKEIKFLKGAPEEVFEAAVKLIGKFDKMEDGIELFTKLDKAGMKAANMAQFLKKLELADQHTLEVVCRFFKGLDDAAMEKGLTVFHKFEKAEDFSKLIERVEQAFYKGTTKVDNVPRDISRTVYQRTDIDWSLKDTKGRTNLERAKLGNAPIGPDGKQIQLHHFTQEEPGIIIEVLAKDHETYYSELHGLIPDGKGSFRNDEILEKQFENFRGSYWRWRYSKIINK
jgi:hypothetical protein